MKGRPLSIMVVGWLFVVVGVVTLGAGVLPLVSAPPATMPPGEFGLVLVVRALAIVGGVGLLYGLGWARWLLIVWLGYHVILSIGHPVLELVVHAALFAGIGFVLFRPGARAHTGRP